MCLKVYSEVSYPKLPPQKCDSKNQLIRELISVEEALPFTIVRGGILGVGFCVITTRKNHLR